MCGHLSLVFFSVGLITEEIQNWPRLLQPKVQPSIPENKDETTDWCFLQVSRTKWMVRQLSKRTTNPIHYTRRKIYNKYIVYRAATMCAKHLHKHKCMVLVKIEVAIFIHQADGPFHVWPVVWSADLVQMILIRLYPNIRAMQVQNSRVSLNSGG